MTEQTVKSMLQNTETPMLSWGQIKKAFGFKQNTKQAKLADEVGFNSTKARVYRRYGVVVIEDSTGFAYIG